MDATSDAELDPQSQAIVAVVLDYFEGWFEGDAGRMERALHRELAKRSLGGDQRWWDADGTTSAAHRAEGSRAVVIAGVI